MRSILISIFTLTLAASTVWAQGSATAAGVDPNLSIGLNAPDQVEAKLPCEDGCPVEAKTDAESDDRHDETNVTEKKQVSAVLYPKSSGTNSKGDESAK